MDEHLKTAIHAGQSSGIRARDCLVSVIGSDLRLPSLIREILDNRDCWAIFSTFCEKEPSGREREKSNVGWGFSRNREGVKILSGLRRFRQLPGVTESVVYEELTT